MFDHIKNKKGEPLFLLVITESRVQQPFIRVCTWEKAQDIFINTTTEVDNENWIIRQLKMERKDNWLKATLLCNHKCWGRDYFKFVCVEPLTDTTP